MKGTVKLFVAAAFAVGSTAQVFAIADNLVFVYDGGYTATQLSDALVSKGHSVDYVMATGGGSLATAMSAGTYTNIWIWDITTSLGMDGTDTAALAAWHATHKPITVDGQSYGIYFAGGVGEQATYLDNIADIYDGMGGGLYIGTDHAPDWTANGNFALSALGYDPIVGSTDNSTVFISAHPFLAGTTAAGMAWPGTTGNVPFGSQPNSTYLHPVLYDAFGVPLVSSSIVPEPASLAALALGGVAILWRRKRA